MKYYSPTTKGFYDKEFHNKIPDDSIKITNEYHQELMDKQAQGFVIRVDENNNVVADLEYYNPENLLAEYKSLRRMSYPQIQDQLDMLWHSMDNDLIPGKGTEWYEAIKTVKDTYPKPH